NVLQHNLVHHLTLRSALYGRQNSQPMEGFFTQRKRSALGVFFWVCHRRDIQNRGTPALSDRGSMTWRSVLTTRIVVVRFGRKNDELAVDGNSIEDHIESFAACVRES